MNMIPTKGRIVHYRHGPNEDDTYAAIVTGVEDFGNLINLFVLPTNAPPFPAVAKFYDEDKTIPHTAFWPPKA